MRRKKDRSAKVAFMAAAIVTALVGVSVISLYSLSGNETGSTAHVASATDTKGTGTGKLLTRLDADAPVVSAEVTVQRSDSSTDPRKTVEEQVAPADTADVIVQDGTELNISLAVVDDALSETLSQPAEEEADASEDQDYSEADESVDAPAYEEAELSLDWEDNDSYTDWEESSYADDSYADGSDSSYTDWSEPSYEDTVWEDSYSDWEDPEYTGEWRFNYDTEEWYYVDAAELVVYDSQVDFGSYDTTSYEEDTYTGWEEPSYEPEYTGEWRFNYDTEEWYYVEDPDAYDSYAGYDTYTDDAYSADDGWEADDNSNAASDGEWVFDDDNSGDDGNDWSDDNDWDSGDDWYDDDSDYVEDSYDYSLGQQIVNYAMGFVGVTPYVWAGRSLYSGTDCSGFVSLIFADFGIYCSPASLNYNGSSFGYLISYDQLQPGDIVVYGGGDHVAIYAGNGYVVHCSSPENGTVYWNMNYRSDISWFLRVIG